MMSGWPPSKARRHVQSHAMACLADEVKELAFPHVPDALQVHVRHFLVQPLQTRSASGCFPGLTFTATCHGSTLRLEGVLARQESQPNA